jgi:hypothetical protein
MENFESSPVSLNKKLNLIIPSSSKITSSEYNNIANNLDSSIPELQFQFECLKNLTNQTQPSSNLVNRSFISTRSYAPKNKLNTSLMNQSITNKIHLSTYAKQCYHLESQIQNKRNILSDYEDFCQNLLDKMLLLQQQNETLKVKIQTSEKFTPTHQVSSEKEINHRMEEGEKIKMISNSLEQLQQNQNTFNSKLNNITSNQITFSNEQYNRSQREIGEQWKEMRKMNEDINLLAKESNNRRLAEEIKINELRLQIQNLEKGLNTKLPTNFSNNEVYENDEDCVNYEEGQVYTQQQPQIYSYSYYDNNK